MKKAHFDKFLEKKGIFENALDGLEQKGMEIKGTGGLLFDNVQTVLNETLYFGHFFALNAHTINK